MQLPQPYLYTSERMPALVDRAQMLPAEGPVADTVFGYHTLWAAEVPFIPAHVGKEERDFDSDSSNRLTRVLQRQVRFLYDLAQSPEHLATFELRLVSWPQPGGYVQVGIAFLGKTFAPAEQTSRQLALGLWDKFSAIFPREAPFSYPLVPVEHLDRAVNSETHSFRQWFEPIPYAHLATPQSIVELRKYEDWPIIRDIGGVLHARDYIPHPFVAALDYSAMARLFETMARQRQVCMVAITLRPQRLTDQEVVILNELAGWYQRAARGEVSIDNRLVEVLQRKLKSDAFESSMRARAGLGQKVYEDLVREHRSLFLVRLQVVGAPVAQDDLIEALGSEVMANAGNAYPSRWTRVEASAAELRWAHFNLQWLEFARWGISSLVQQDRRIVRLRSLATVSEAAGAFRLPVAPSSGGLAGLEVRDEPFSLSLMPPGQGEKSMGIGMTLDRGVPTGIPFQVSLSTLVHITHVFGDATATRRRAVQHLLQGLGDAAIPWVFICGAFGSGKALAESTDACRVVVDAASVSSVQDCLPVHPLEPPPGVPLIKFLDALVRLCMAVYGLEASTGPFLRHALSEAYRNAGWTAQSRGKTIDLLALAGQIETATGQYSLPSEVVKHLHANCLLPLRDLATVGADLLRASEKSSALPVEPLIIEVGWLGSDSNQIFVQGCLWAWYLLAFAALGASQQELRAVVGVEDAHTLFGSRCADSAFASPLASLAYSNAAAGVGTLLVDDRADLLDKELMERASLTIATLSINRAGVERVAALLRVSSRQQMRLRHLKNMEAAVAVGGMVPALIAL